MADSTSSTASTSSPPSPTTCGAHKPLVDKLDDGFRRMGEGFDILNRRMDELFRDLGAREEADKTQGREIRELRKRADATPTVIAEAIVAHRASCAIGDITRTEVRLPDRRHQDRGHTETYDTPTHGSRRQSFAPGPGVFKIPVPKLVIWLAIGIGVAIAAGGWAWGLLRENAEQILPQRPAATAPGHPDLPRRPLADVGSLTP